MGFIENRLSKIIGEQLAIHESAVRPMSRLREDLGATSFDLVQLITALEETFEVPIGEDMAGKVRTVAELVVLIQGGPPGRLDHSSEH